MCASGFPEYRLLSSMQTTCASSARSSRCTCPSPLEHVVCLGLLRDRDRAGSGQRETQIRPARRYPHTQADREHVVGLRMEASSSVYFAGGCPRSKDSSRSSRCACAERCRTRWHCRLCADCRARTACACRPRGSAAPAERRPSGSGPHLEHQCGAGHS